MMPDRFPSWPSPLGNLGRAVRRSGCRWIESQAAPLARRTVKTQIPQQTFNPGYR